MSQWIGYMVSLNCGAKGTIQGEIVAATGTTITLSKAFCDGIPCSSTSVTINASEIADLKLIEKQENEGGESVVKMAKPIPKRAGRTNSTSETGKMPNSFQNYSSKSKPIDIVDVKQSFNDMSLSFKNGTPNKNKSKGGRYMKPSKDEICFGSPWDIEKDFDFEKNLALFDKQAVWNELNSQKPDVVKQTDGRKGSSKLRHDESVLNTMPTVYRQIVVPKQEFCEYVTDEGLIIPSISRTLRHKLWAAADRMGLGWERRIELMGRGITEMTLQLIGGGHRLNPHNTHQRPHIVIIAGSHRQGAMGINAARHLASHGVNTILFLTNADNPEVTQELLLYKLTKNRVITNVAGLPQFVDLIIVALYEDSDNPYPMAGLNDISTWTRNNKAPVLAVDPPSAGTPSIPCKYAIVPILPLAHSAKNGKVYLCNLGFPVEIFHEVGIKYKSPFGAKFIIPLHPNEDI